MPEPLKNQFGAPVVARIAAMIAAVYERFDARAFCDDVLDGFEALELMPRAQRIADALHRHLPADYAQAARIIIKCLGPRLQATAGNGMTPFMYWPLTIYIARHGLDAAHFELSMQAQHELTQRFTAEFSIRAFLERHPQRTLARLRQWATDDNPHVRRLVSEGTRTRLPWAGRLREFQRDPAPVIALLELLKDDPHEYVRRSVANNLNDIGKDHPGLLIEICRRWLDGAPPQRRALISRALRTLVKQGDERALALLGFGSRARLKLGACRIEPARPRIGDSLRIECELINAARSAQTVLADLRVHYVKADGSSSVKVFKLQAVTLNAGERRRVGKTLSLRQMSTRRHYPGRHRVELLLNGRAHPIGEFELVA